MEPGSRFASEFLLLPNVVRLPVFRRLCDRTSGASGQDGLCSHIKPATHMALCFRIIQCLSLPTKTSGDLRKISTSNFALKLTQLGDKVCL